MKKLLVSLVLVCATILVVAARADDEDATAPEIRAVSLIHGVTFTLTQHEAPSAQGTTTMITRIHSAIPPGPPNVPPVAIDLRVRVIAPDMAFGHAAGALAALGLMHGLTVQEIRDGFAQLNWPVQIVAVSGQVAPNAIVSSAKAGALAQLLISVILTDDRPGGGCLAAIPLVQQGAMVLGFPSACQ